MPKLNVNEETKELIDKIIRSQRQMIPLHVHTNANMQKDAYDNQIFELRRTCESGIPSHVLVPIVAGNPCIFPDGIYVFVILVTEPMRIYCGSKNGACTKKRYHLPYYVDGHASLSNKKDVLFAGILFFHNNELVFWDNESGHYKPEAKLRFTNIPPYLKHILPEDKFRTEKMKPEIELLFNNALGVNDSDFSGDSSSSLDSY